MFRNAIVLTGAAGLVLTLEPAVQPAQAAPTTVAAACALGLGSFTSD